MDVERLSKYVSAAFPFLLEDSEPEADHVVWHVTNRCNMDCAYCFTESGKRGEAPDEEVLLKVAEEIGRARPGVLSVIGGEPLTVNVKTLKKALEIVKELSPGTVINLDTNATLVTGEIVDELKECVHQWNTTVDSVDGRHNETRGRLEDTLRGIKVLKEKGCRVAVNVVVSSVNADEEVLRDTVRVLREMGVDRVVLSPAKDIGRGKGKRFSPVNNDYERVVDAVRKVMGEGAEADGWTDPRVHVYDRESCFCGVERVTVDWEGKAYPCELMRCNGVDVLEEGVVGAMRKMKWWAVFTLAEPPECADCAYREVCNKGCRYITYLSSDVPFAKPVLCGVKKNSVYEVIGYRPYSPIWDDWKKRISKEEVKVVVDHVGERVIELGAGGGVWMNILEDEGVHVKGYEINRTMIELWEIYKRVEGKKAEMVYGDAREAEVGTYLMMDNFISHFEEGDLVKLLRRAERAVIQFAEREVPEREETYTYVFNGKEIEERVVPTGGKKIRKRVYNGIASAEMEQWVYSKKDVEEIAKKAGHRVIYEHEGKSVVIVTEKTSYTRTGVR